MKKTCCLLLIFFSVEIYAQNCTNYYFLQNNKTVEITIKDKKGNMAGRQVYTMSNASTVGGVTSATVNTEMFDKKGKSTASSTNVMKCTGGVLMMDMKISLPQQQAEQFSKGEAKAESVYIEYPASMSVGDQLKEGNFAMEMNTNNMVQTLSYVVSERKVEAKESVTTAAGTWECYKISFKAKMSIKTMGIGFPLNMDGVEWYAPGFGVVKSETKWGSTEVSSIK